jgi:hypothetical protein
MIVGGLLYFLIGGSGVRSQKVLQDQLLGPAIAA